jgi:predicted alpha-1,6-mannanase (GH76 family)
MKWNVRSGYLVLIAWILWSVSIPSSNAGSSNEPNSSSWDQRCSLAVHSLQSWYDDHTGLYRTTGWWNAANAVTTLADYSRITGSKEYFPIFQNTRSAAQQTYPGFINRFYDDEGWWALAWIDVYDLTNDPQYLTLAESIFSNMADGWDNTCSGGIWWSKDKKYKNAIANGLFLSVAAHLASRANRPQQRALYRSWANREWQWFSHSHMINADHLVNDGLTESCANNNLTTWTYNQGVIVGALAEFYKTSHHPALLANARTIAAAALSAPALVDPHGILHDPCEPKCGADGTQFKGIFVRNLRSLEEIAPLPLYENFIYTNADSIWTGAQPPSYRLGPVWIAPFGAADASTQSSALDTLIAAAEISKH